MYRRSSTQPPVPKEKGDFFPLEVKRPERDADNLFPSSAEFKNAWNISLLALLRFRTLNRINCIITIIVIIIFCYPKCKLVVSNVAVVRSSLISAYPVYCWGISERFWDSLFGPIITHIIIIR